MIKNPFARKQPAVTIGGQKVPVSPLTLENALTLILLLAPHLALIERHWGEFQRALQGGNGDRPQILQAVFTALRREMQNVPYDMIRAMALLVESEPTWVSQNITAQEFVAALPVLDRVNDFPQMWAQVVAFGLTAKYTEEANG